MPGRAVFTPTQADYVKANRLVLRTSRLHRWVTWLGFAMLAVAGATITLDRWRGWGIGTAINDAVGAIAAGVTALALPLVWRWQVPRSVAKQFTQRPEMGAPTELTWDEDHVSFKADTGSSLQRWATLHRQLVDGSSFILLLTDRLMLLVPRRALSTDAWHDLVTTAERYGPSAG